MSFHLEKVILPNFTDSKVRSGSVNFPISLLFISSSWYSMFHLFSIGGYYLRNEMVVVHGISFYKKYPDQFGKVRNASSTTWSSYFPLLNNLVHLGIFV